MNKIIQLKWGADLNRKFLIYETQMFEKQKGSIFLPIWEM